MKKTETVLRNLKDRINLIFEKLEKRDEGYESVETEFELAMNDEENSKSVLDFLNPKKFIKEVESAISELRNDKKAQESYLLYTYGSLVMIVDTWCYGFDNSGNYAADLMIKEMEDFQKTVSFNLSKQEKIEKKKEGIYVKPIEPSSDIFDLIELLGKYENSNFEVTEEIMKPYLALSKLIERKIKSIRETLDYKSEYRATQLYTQVNEFEKELLKDKNSYGEIFFNFWRRPTPNEIQMMNAFWEIVERLDESNFFPKLKNELAPENVIRNFLSEKIHFNEEEKDKPNDKYSIFQKLMMIKALGLDEFLLYNTQLTQAQMCKVLGALSGCNYKVFENYFGEYDMRIKRRSNQIEKDTEIVQAFFEKNRMSDLIKSGILEE